MFGFDGASEALTGGCDKGVQAGHQMVSLLGEPGGGQCDGWWGGGTPNLGAPCPIG